MNRPFSATINETRYTCLPFADKELKLSGNLIKNEHQDILVYKDNELTHHSWQEILQVGDSWCILLDSSLTPFPLTDLGTERRAEALTTVLSLSRLLSTVSDKDAQYDSGVLNLYRIWGIDGGGAMLLPPALGNLIMSYTSPEVQKEKFNIWVHYHIHQPISLADQMVQLLYLGAAGFPPYADPATREDNCNAIPLSQMSSNLPSETVSFIDSFLHMKLNAQKDLGGNWDRNIVLQHLLPTLEKLKWCKLPRVIKENANSFIEKQEKRANRKKFIRKKGLKAGLITAGVLIVLAILFSVVKRKLTPPYTYRMSDEQIISEYYIGQNELDLTKMEASLAPGVKSPSQMEVVSLYVNRQTRLAYENTNAILTPEQYLALEKKQIPADMIIYGVSDLEIEKIGDNLYTTHFLLWTPSAYDESDEELLEPESGTVNIFRYPLSQTFTLGTNKRDWRLIYNIESEREGRGDVIAIPTYQRGRKAGS